jgi:hypothetical protein
MQITHRCERAILEHRLFAPTCIFVAIAEHAMRRVHGRHCKPGGLHTERFEHFAPHVVLITGACGHADDAAEQRVAVVRTLVHEARHPCERDACADELYKAAVRHVELTVAPGVVRHEAGRMCEQVSHANVPCIRGRVVSSRKCRHPSRSGRIEHNLVRVAQLQHGRAVKPLVIDAILKTVSKVTGSPLATSRTPTALR